MKPTELEKRRGRFYASVDTLDSPNVMGFMGFMGNMFITRCEYIYTSAMFEYCAYSPLFDVCENGAEPPEYLIQYDSNKNRYTAERADAAPRMIINRTNGRIEKV